MFVPKFSNVLSAWIERVHTLTPAQAGERKLERFPMRQPGFNAASKLIPRDLSRNITGTELNATCKDTMALYQ